MGRTLPFTNQDVDSRSMTIHGWLHCVGSATNIPMSKFSFLISDFQYQQYFKFYTHFQLQMSKKDANSMNVTASEVLSFISEFN